jgi:DNA-binding GntR family transcriptional regulator
MRIIGRTRSNPVPLEPPRSQYRRLADLLRGAIERGEYPPGSVLPSEPELSQRYGVSRPTINRAVSILRAQGPGPGRSWPGHDRA